MVGSKPIGIHAEKSRVSCFIMVFLNCWSEEREAKSGMEVRPVAASAVLPMWLIMAAYLQLPASATTSAPFDCAAGWNNWQKGWSPGKKAWCCIYYRRACPDTTTTKIGSFDCNAGLQNAEQGWSRKKKAWCCEREPPKGCAPASAPTPAPTNQPASVARCAATCGYGGKSFDCAARIRYTARKHFHNQPGACEKAFGRVLGQCGVCSHCPLAEAHCTAAAPRLPPPPHLPAPAAPADHAPCSNVCSYKGKSVSCSFRIKWGAHHRYLYQDQACKKAWIMVLSQCPNCAHCALGASGCVPQPPPPAKHPAPKPEAPEETVLFDCLSDHHNDESGWSDKQRDWCCKDRGRGCSGSSWANEPAAYDCLAGLNKWRNSWTDKKKEWCCKQRKKGCLFDCLAGLSKWQSGWSDKKQSWCCRNSGHGCGDNDRGRHSRHDEEGKDQHETVASSSSSRGPTTSSEPYNCNAGYGNWQKGWSGGKKRWCCEKYDRGCPGTTTRPDYDCLAGLARWEDAWPEAKQDWCCKHHGRGCPKQEATTNHGDSQGHDCHKGLSNWQDEWTPEKKDWCCQHEEIHCQGPRYDCLAGIANWENLWPDSKKDWCCKHKGKGCNSPAVSGKFSELEVSSREGSLRRRFSQGFFACCLLAVLTFGAVVSSRCPILRGNLEGQLRRRRWSWEWEEAVDTE